MLLIVGGGRYGRNVLDHGIGFVILALHLDGLGFRPAEVGLAVLHGDGRRAHLIIACLFIGVRHGDARLLARALQAGALVRPGTVAPVHDIIHRFVALFELGLGGNFHGRGDLVARGNSLSGHGENDFGIRRSLIVRTGRIFDGQHIFDSSRFASPAARAKHQRAEGETGCHTAGYDFFHRTPFIRLSFWR